MAALSSLKIAHSHGRIWTPSNTRVLGPIRSQNLTASRSIQPFLHRSPRSVCKRYNRPSLSLKIAPTNGGMWIPSNQTDRPTDHTTWSVISMYRYVVLRCVLTITSGHNTASPPQTDGSIVVARWRQCALPCGHIGATWRLRLNLCFLQPTRVHNPNVKSIGSVTFS